jgi:hypothetical protein
LRFDTKTNALGAAGALCFLATGGTYVNASADVAVPLAAALLAGWIVLMGLSYALRGIEKG